MGRRVLKKRIIPVQLLLDDRLVKTVKFGTYRDVGDPIKSSGVYNSQYADELIFLNITRDASSVEPLARLIEKVSEVSFMPLAVGGGIRGFDDAAFLIKNGADKIVLNSAAYDRPELITEIADTFGAQAVIVCVDARWDDESQTYALYSHCGDTRRNVPLRRHVERMVAAGCGEILIQSIDRDGTMQGYDLRLIEQVVSVASVPVIACGGAGTYEHLKDAFLATGVSAVACGSLFNFSDSNPIRAKAFLSNYGLAFKVV